MSWLHSPRPERRIWEFPAGALGRVTWRVTKMVWRRRFEENRAQAIPLLVDQDLAITMIETLRVWEVLCQIDLLRCRP
jgi:hypothetical protein